jgi:ribose transport system substrate-binding protein
MLVTRSRLGRGLTLATAAAVTVGLTACGSGSGASTTGATSDTPASSVSSSSPSSAGDVSALSTAIDSAYDGTDKGNFTTLPQPTVRPGTAFKVGFLQTNGGQPFLVAMQDAAEAEVNELGGSFIALDAASNPQTQASELSQLISQHVNVIIGDPVVATALGPGIAQAKKAGIPFVAIGTPADETKSPIPGAVTSISQGFDYSSYATMKALAAEHPGATFATMGFAPPVDQLIFMMSRLKYWGERFGLKFAGEDDAASDDPSGWAPAASTILTKYPSATLILTYNDGSAVAMATTASISGRKISVACPNAALSITHDALQAGKLDLVHRTPWEQEGAQSAIAAYDTLTNQNQPLPKFINVNGYIVTPATASKATWIK